MAQPLNGINWKEFPIPGPTEMEANVAKTH